MFIKVTERQVDAQTGVQYTFGELLDGCRRVAAGLRRLGLRTGDIVAFHCVNSYESMVTMCGTFFAGGVANLIKTNLTHGEVRPQLIVAQPIFVVCDLKDAEKVKNVCEGIASLKSVIVTTGACEGTRMLSELMQSSMGGVEALINPNPDAVLAIFYSSGSTGFPKGVLLTHRNIIAQVISFRNQASNTSTPSNCLSKCPALALPTTAFLFPTIVHKLDQSPLTDQLDTSSLTKVIVGGSTLTSSVLQSVVQKLHLPGIIQAYGMTELTGGAASSTPQLDDLKSVGRPLPFIEIKVVHPESRQTLGPNEQGEICVRGPNCFKGYFKNDIKTSEAYENGFVRTGDIGYYSADGRIFICGRLKELIKCMDQQVAPAELEELLAADPDVLQVIVVGVPHPQYGEAPRAFVVPRRRLPGPDEEAREADRLKNLVAANFANHKHLYGGVQFMDSIPLTGNQKNSRSSLKELYIQQNRCANQRCLDA
ncbi:probable 4-coumarate--CoA ligase 1 [Dermacentor silvarum]|uniref:probable 4-coumarate--CoA ligase 1 n=1 Tax=Dermacentor silvarum TaxID=543639 RepID=UPI0021008630|nr:probable 4-coumarate--CoA ligase 1 [Dermacentor silvarum]